MNNKKDPPKNHDPYKNENMAGVPKPTSLKTLIIWNVSKAQENNPTMKIKSAIRAAQARLDAARDVSAVLDRPEERHLACAVLAWHQLGHSHADSLCQFIEDRMNEQECHSVLSEDNTHDSVGSSKEPSKGLHSMRLGSSSTGPVIKLPLDTKIVMRMDATQTCKRPTKNTQAPAKVKDTMNKIDAACCLDSACAKGLSAMETATTELRMRAGLLARREAERVELLERAEAAWRDLELGYQRRLLLAEEKEDDLTRQIQKAIEERYGFKNACTTLAQQLKEKGEKAEKERVGLSAIEKELCERACVRLKVTEESAKGDALLAEHQCRAAQLERDLQFKEEQARRNLLNFQSELESSQTITHETERVMRAELSGLREQVTQVSHQLLGEDTENARIRAELEGMRQEKNDMLEDLEGCKASCDAPMQSKVDELNKKQGQLNELKERVTECRCKQPVDATVEVKRTASLAALCRCTPEEKIFESCSCTSLRSSLLSNLLADLFGGLQAEMDGAGAQMPCQLLKCLEDKHNWDRASVVKTNLKDYFSHLLVGELDIAIATSIEKYHAKWVGQSCADTSRMVPDQGEDENEGWQQQAIERRAQTLATKLAEQLFQERSDELAQRAMQLVAAGPPPCECKPASTSPTRAGRGREGAELYPVLVNQTLPVNRPSTSAMEPGYWHQAMQDVTQLRVQIEDLQKDAIKKEDLKLMEEKITKIVQRASVTEKVDCPANNPVSSNVVKEFKINRSVSSNQSNYLNNLNKPTCSRKKQLEANNLNNRKVNKAPLISQYNGLDKSNKPYKKHGQTYAINMCMCAQKDPNKLSTQSKTEAESFNEDNRSYQRSSKDMISPMSTSVKQTKPINSSLQSQDISTRSISKYESERQSCSSTCKCFNKVPSNTSIDKLLETLAKWKSDLNSTDKGKIYENNCCHYLPENEILLQNEFELCKKKSVKKELDDSFDSIKKVPDIEEESTVTSNISSKSSRSDEERGQTKIRVENVDQNKIVTPTKKKHFSLDRNSNDTDQTRDEEKSRLKTIIHTNEKNNTLKTDQNNDSNHKRKIDMYNNKENTSINKKRNETQNTQNHTSKTPIKKEEYKKEKNTIINNATATNENSSSKDTRKYSSDSKTKQTKTTYGTAYGTAFNVPTSTASEYMGAINLDKSNEDYCKCESGKSSCLYADEPFQCLTTGKCSCKTSPINENIQNEGMQDVITSKPRPTVMKYLQKNLSPKIKKHANEEKEILPDEENDEDCDYLKYLKSLKNISADQNDLEQTKTDIEPCDCGYNIKFLGVTLTNVNPQIKNDPTYEDINGEDTSDLEANKNLKPSITNTLKTNREKNDKPKISNSKKPTINADEKVYNVVNMDKSEISQFGRDGSSKHLKSNTVTNRIMDLEQNFNGKNNEKRLRKGESTDFDTYLPSNLFDNIKPDHDGDNTKKPEGTTYNQVDNSKFRPIKLERDASNLPNNDQQEDSELLFNKTNSSGIKKCCESLNCSMNKNQQTNEDKGLDIQSLKDKDESCICCDRKNNEDSNDLEENAFHLLEEHLKKKLDDFKQSSCNSTCIPPEEEEKLFSTILMRVKQVINDSTNNITCKCSKEAENSLGSWNRAYGLLQEYLKTKIKRVQCECVSVKEEKDENVLPDVLEKVCNLIENDFQRLKDVCGCTKVQENTTNRQVYFKEEEPERDIIIKQIRSCRSQSPQTSAVVKENMSSQVPACLQMDTKSCNPMETYTKAIQTLEEAQECLKSFVTVQNVNKLDYCMNKLDSELLGTKKGDSKQLAEYTREPYDGFASECVCKGTECTDNSDTNTKQQFKEHKCCNVESKADAEITNAFETIKKESSGTPKNDHLCKNSSTHCCRKHYNDSKSDKNTSLFPNKPYIGYTLSCSCDVALGTCVCTKSIIKNDENLMNDILKKSVDNQKVSYIMKGNPTENTTNKTDLSEMAGDLYIHNILKHKTLYEDPAQDCETEVSLCDENDLLTLKKSREYFDMANTTTNTYDDNLSSNTDYSNNDVPLDWCECCSNLPAHDLNSDQLKRSMYLPIPLGNFDGNLGSVNKISNEVNEPIPKHCDCDMVPICHVKMLVESIENKLVGAKCTCDSMIPRVCPIHSNS